MVSRSVCCGLAQPPFRQTTPVGLTSFRTSLFPLRSFCQPSCRRFCSPIFMKRGKAANSLALPIIGFAIWCWTSYVAARTQRSRSSRKGKGLVPGAPSWRVYLFNGIARMVIFSNRFMKPLAALACCAAFGLLAVSSARADNIPAHLAVPSGWTDEIRILQADFERERGKETTRTLFLDTLTDLLPDWIRAWRSTLRPGRCAGKTKHPSPWRIRTRTTYAISPLPLPRRHAAESA